MNLTSIVYINNKWLIVGMSAEKIILDEKKDLSGIIPSVNIDKASSGRVDINVLISRVRLEKQKENKTTLVFLGLIISLFIVVGIILSI
tara:strand:+ start:302 stop:568 length:267 start_codon:yes stop_codon:yes gene_type:complete